MNGLKALLWVLVVGVLCVPAILFGSSDITTPLDTLSHQAPHLRAVWESNPPVDSDGLQEEPGYHVTGKVDELVTFYVVNCGSTYAPHPPAYTNAVTRDAITPIDVMIQGTATNKRQAIAQAMDQAKLDVTGRYKQWGNGPITAPPQQQGMQDYCSSEHTVHAWQTFFISPIGWLVLLLLIAAFSGGFASGSPVIRGSVTPRAFGGGWFIRLWR